MRLVPLLAGVGRMPGVEWEYRSLLIAETNCGYAALRESGDALEELEVLEGSLADGLEPRLRRRSRREDDGA